jgi:hypothetical protein
MPSLRAVTSTATYFVALVFAHTSCIDIRDRMRQEREHSIDYSRHIRVNDVQRECFLRSPTIQENECVWRIRILVQIIVKAAILMTRRLDELQQQLLHAFTMLGFISDGANDVNFKGSIVVWLVHWCP